MFGDWVIKLTFDKKKYALKHGIIYSTIIAIILITPLFIYVQLMININEAKSKLELKKRAYEILYKIDQYKPAEEEYFNFPRFSSFQAGLYDDNFKAVFTLIDEIPIAMDSGFYKHQKQRFYVLNLPNHKYFGAKYLVVQKEINNYEIYQMALFSVLLILSLLFILSYYIFRNFALPFEKINRQLDNFMKDSMHEINTPLSIINVNVDLYARKHGQNKYLRRIKAAAKTLSNIYDDMDYLIKQEIVNYPLAQIDLSRFLTERIDYFQEVAILREVSISADIEPEITLLFNKTKLQRIIDNTLSNAIKYSYEKGTIEVSLKYVNKDIVMVVEDFGVGIENPDKIFERYYRENLDKGGFGIGLNIVKKIIDEHEVTLKIESTVKKGSRFIYKF